MNLTVTAESSVNPTEDQTKVERALRNIFPSGKIELINVGQDVVRLRVRGDNLEFLETLRNLIRQERIRSAARSVILNRTRGNKMHLYLNKQAALVNRVSFCEPVGESPLGPISVEIDTETPETVIDFLASRSGDGAYRKFQGDR